MNEAKDADKPADLKTEEVEIGAKELGLIAEAVGEQVADKAAEASAAAAAKAAEEVLAKYVAKTEDIDKKEVGDPKDAKDAKDGKAAAIDARFKDLADMTPEMRFFRAARALANGDSGEVKRYNEYTIGLREKANYANTAEDADGGALVPDPEFDTAIYENLPNYGVAFANADVRQTERNSVRVINLLSGLEFYSTAEAGVKTGAKLSFSKQLTDLEKYAVIVPSTDELSDDAAVDFWNLVTRELSRAYGKKADEVTFTDSDSGITESSGVLTHSAGSSAADFHWDDLLTAEGKVEDGQDTANAKWFMRREDWFRLAQLKAASGDGSYLFQPNPNNPTTPWGTPVVFTRVLSKVGDAAANQPFAVYGDLKNYILYNKRGMALTILREATVKDAGDSDFNLATQDGTAMRAVVRMLGILPTGNRTKFVVLGLGTVS